MTAAYVALLMISVANVGQTGEGPRGPTTSRGREAVETETPGPQRGLGPRPNLWHGRPARGHTGETPVPQELPLLRAPVASAWTYLAMPGPDTRDVVVRSDNVVIDRSCRVVIPAGTAIEDTDANGVIQIKASGITVQFADGSVLQGAKKGTRPDEYRGYGIRLNGHEGVTIRGAQIHGYWCAIWAGNADGLTIEDGDVSDCRRAYLKSTPAAEDAGDWLYPHHNDGNEWLTEYGAAIYVEDSNKVTVRRCRARDGQNGLCLDRVNDSKIYDSDFSFLSGWGIALWRSSRNVICRNAVDFCVRGYSHGVYNRGQDSAGFLVFEQCCDNVFAENSATHGGDGFFGFAGREAVGEAPAPTSAPASAPSSVPTSHFNYQRRGDNDNLLVNNDFSYAAAHGIEMTFSFGNRFIGNRLVGDAICGVWGGYSQDTLVAGNTIEENGQAGYGPERGGVNIEHGRGNRILHNGFRRNECGVHLWWDDDGDLLKKPWALANGTDSKDNVIAGNTFDGDRLALHFRGPSEATIGANTFIGVEREMEAEAVSKTLRESELKIDPLPSPEYQVYGDSRPVGARKDLRGRQNIIMTEWGPWDHTSPLVRLAETTGRRRVYELRQMPGELGTALRGAGVQGRLLPATGNGQTGNATGNADTTSYEVWADQPGVYPYTLKFSAGDYTKEIKDVLVVATWTVTFFKWTKDADPRQHLAEWRKSAEGAGAVTVTAEQLAFKYAFGGPSALKLSEALTNAKLGSDSFGMIARTKLLLPKGKWRFWTYSDDGVRVKVDGRPVIDNWTWHVPTRDEAAYEQPSDTAVEIVVEHFEIDGYAVLEFGLGPDA